MHLNKWNTRWDFIFFDISKQLVAYKHTYFVQRNRMKCGHSRNLFYVSRSCFSFYLHTFLMHLNKWNTRWYFIFFDISKQLVAYKHTYFVQRNRMKCGHSRLFYVSRSCFSFYFHTFVTHLFFHFYSTHLNKWNTRSWFWHFHFYSFLFDIWKILVAYKHTYFVQRNRMKCGHSRNLFYVSRSCFSFYLHTFLMHLNKWNTRWDFIFFDISKQLVAYKHTYFVHNGIEWNVVIVGIYFTCLEAVFHFIYTLFWRT